VAVVLGDEWSRTPLFAQDVLATFKTYGHRPEIGFDLFDRPRWINVLLLAKYARATAAGAKGRLKRGVARLGGRLPPIVPIPMGYGNQVDLPIRPLTQRSTDVFFAGSVQHGGGDGRSRYRPRNPKNLARASMLEALERLGAARPDLAIRTSTTPSFTLNAIYYGTEAGSEALDLDAYSAALMDAKICLVPRGTNVETFRYFEALRYGCIAIAEPQPDFPFYRGAPVVEIRDWSTADRVILDLLADGDRMSALHHEGLAWWRDRCSPEVIGRMMAETVRAELERDPTRGAGRHATTNTRA
jgi:hypothetical protein